MLDARFPAVLFSNGIGDHLLNLPAARALASLFPDRLALVCQSGARNLVFGDLPFRLTCEASMEMSKRARFFDADAVAAAIEPCDLLISLNPWHSSSVDRLLERLAPAASIGFFSEFQRHVPLDFDKHSLDLAFDIVRCLDPSRKPEDFAAPPVFLPRFREQATRLRRFIPAGFNLLAVHADTGPEKMWPRERFVKLLDLFLDRRPDFVAIVVGCEDLRLDSGRCGDRVIPCYGLPFETSVSLVAQCDLFLGIDSALLHAADLCRVPGVGLFGPTSPIEWGFRFALHRHVCARGSMLRLSEGAVVEALEDLLAEIDSASSNRRARAV